MFLSQRLSEFKTDTNKHLDALNGTTMKTDIHDMKGELKLLRWMLGVTLTITIGIGIRLLFM